MSNPVLQRFDLTGRTVVITGAGGALCGAMADALASMGVILHIDQATGKLSRRASKVIAYTAMDRYGCADDKWDI